MIFSCNDYMKRKMDKSLIQENRNLIFIEAGVPIEIINKYMNIDETYRLANRKNRQANKKKVW